MSPEVVNKLKIIEDCGRNTQMKLRGSRDTEANPVAEAVNVSLLSLGSGKPRFENLFIRQ